MKCTDRKASIYQKLDIDKNCWGSRKLAHYNTVYLKEKDMMSNISTDEY